MRQANAILGLLAQTSIHAGTGQNTGVIDLPIQREGHNGWPCIFGSAVKGAIRTRAEDSLPSTKQADTDKTTINPSIAFVFGSESNETDSHAGAVAFSDARLLLFPVRSLTSQFKWVTCPAALKRYQKDAARLGKTINITLPADSLDDSTAFIAHHVDNNALFLEEYRFTAEKVVLTDIIAMLAKLMQGDNDENTSLLTEQLTLISDNMFSYIVQHTTPVTPHIAIESETKIVKNGALWYEESLPPESLLYTTLSASKARKKEAEQSATVMLKVIADLFPDNNAWLQLGGNETVGMGWCAVKMQREEA